MNGFFAMSEMAIVSSRRGRLRQMADSDKGAALALDMNERPGVFLSIVQLCMTLNSVFAGAFSGATFAKEFAVYLQQIPVVADYSNSLALASTVAVVTYLNLVVGELLPKRVGLSYAEPIAAKVAPFMRAIALIAAPFVWVLRQSTEISLRMMQLARPRDTKVTQEEISELIAEGTMTGALKPLEKHMLDGVMRIADRSVRSIMTPRIDMVWLKLDDPVAHHKNTIRSSGYSRFPVARGDLEEILGIVHAKDMLNASLEGLWLSLRPLMRPALLIPESAPVLSLLDQFKQTGQHIAIVIDEYGSVQGLVTGTDVLQGIAGAMPEAGHDEDDGPVQREDGSWLIDGMTSIDDLRHLTGLKELPVNGDFHTVAGFMIDRLGRIPVSGDHFHWQDARFEVLDMDGRRIDKILVSLEQSEPTFIAPPLDVPQERD